MPSNVAKVAILAGGDGTRLSSVSKGLLLKLWFLLLGCLCSSISSELCKSHDFTDIALSVRQGHQ